MILLYSLLKSLNRKTNNLLPSDTNTQYFKFILLITQLIIKNNKYFLGK